MNPSLDPNFGIFTNNHHPPSSTSKHTSINLSKQNNISSTPSNSTKSDEERRHIQDLSARLPDLTNIFELHRKIGEGSFSSVFLATLKSQNNVSLDERKHYAIKHLVPTSHPSRIEQELRCLKYIGGQENVVGIDFCMRKSDTVIFVMPYLPHTKFSKYVHKMDVMETKIYMKNLLLALRRVHQFNIIHRDVKPSNFLYDRENRRFLLVDFGLAQKIDTWPTAPDVKDIYKPETFNKNALTINLEMNAKNSDLSALPKKRKLTPPAEQGNDSIEPCLKRLHIDPQSVITENFPLKPLQEDHPKISTISNSPQMPKIPTISPKMAAVKRQVFADGTENNSIQNPNANHNKPANPSPPPNTVQMNMNIINNSLATLYQRAASYSHMVDPYNNYLPNLNVARMQQKMSPYYSNYPCNQYNYESILASYSNYYNRQINVNTSIASNHNLPNNPMLNFSHPMQQGSINNFASSSRTIKVANRTGVGLNNQTASGYSRGKAGMTLDMAGGGKKQINGKKACACGGKAMVCSICLTRGAYNAPRAGTQGFRPPEVLLKYAEQTTAVDMWACGVILMSVISGCYPFFRAPDDITALAEMVTLFGSQRLKEVANILGRNLVCSYTKRPVDIKKLCINLRRCALVSDSPEVNDFMEMIQKPVEAGTKPNLKNGLGLDVDGTMKYKSEAKTYNGGNKSCRYSDVIDRRKNGCSSCCIALASCICKFDDQKHPSNRNTGINGYSIYYDFPDEAFDLLDRLLDLNPHTRITASEALQHPFFSNL